MRNKLTYAALACAFAFGILGACTDSTKVLHDDAEPTASASNTPPAEATPTPEPTPKLPAEEFTIVSGGDILLHLSVNDSARTGGEHYDYEPLYTGIKPYIEQASLALCALEVPIVGQDELPSNYPNFGAPWDLADSLARIGYDGCAVATNHSRDRGFSGINTTIEALQNSGLGWAGTARDEAESNQIQFYELPGKDRTLTVAHIAATTLTNGLPVDPPFSWNVVGNLGNPVSTVIDDAKRARELGADLVVVSMHWGTEYVNDPIPEQTEIAQQLADSGQIDLVFGNHSHVPEPTAKIPGGPGGNGMWVVYSMGNQISGQTVENHGPRVTTGLLTTATVTLDDDGARVTGFDWMAVTQDRPAGDRLWPLSPLVNGQYPEGLVLSPSAIAARADVTYPVMAQSGPERTQPPTSSGAAPQLSRRG